MVALNIDTAGFRRTGDLVDLASTLLGGDFDESVPTPPCASDPASEAIMRNLNARADWLLAHVRTGAQQASNAAAGMSDTAADYDAADLEGASYYSQFGGSSGAGAAPAALTGGPRTATPAQGGMPNVEPIPDVSGTEGETLALQLEMGAGPGPAVAASVRFAGLAARAQAANMTLVDAHTALLATGESQATPGMAAKLTRGIAFTQAVAGHATALSGHYEAAGNLHTLTYSQVGPSAGWQALKTGYAESQMENAMTGGLAQAKVDAYKQALDDQDQLKGTAASGLQAGGNQVSTPPGDVPDPGMDPNGQGAPGDQDKKGDGKDKKKTDDPKDPSAKADSGKGMQDMLQPLMGALGQLTQGLGKANPLESVGKMAQEVGQQVSKMAGQAGKGAGGNPFNPAALAKPMTGAGKGGSGGGTGGGGGGSIKPASTLPSATHPASLTGTPAATPATSPPVKPAAASGTGGTGGAGAAGGMMPMGHKPGGDGKSAKINSYEAPLPEVNEAGRPGVVGEAAKPAAPAVNPEAQNAVKARLAKRKKDEAGDDGE